MRNKVIFVIALLSTLVGGAAWGTNPFVDIGGTGSHMNNIDAIYSAGITLGCTDTTHYCPTDFVTRAQMASFLARLGGLSSNGTDNLPKTNGRSAEQVYCALAAANPGSFKGGPCETFVEIVDGAGPVSGTSIAIGADGLPIISYLDSDDLQLKVAKCTDLSCSGPARITTLTGDAGASAIAIAGDGLPVIAYHHNSTSDLRVAKCAEASCSTGATFSAPHTVGNVAFRVAIAIGADGLPIISYDDNTDFDLEVFKCTTQSCGSGTQTTIDSDGSVGAGSAITIGADGTPVIAYVHEGLGDLKVAKCNTADCAADGKPTQITTIDSDDLVGSYPSIAIGLDELPVISYFHNTLADLRVAKCTVASCLTSSIVTIDSAGEVGQYTSIAVGTDGLPVISYLQGIFDNLRMARCATPSCAGTPTILTLDSLSGFGSSIAIGTDARPIISHVRADTGPSTPSVIKVARPPLG